MDDKVKLIIEIPKEAKEYFDKPVSDDFKYSYYDHNGIIGKAIQNGILLDSNSERAEAQAYFAGEAYGWEQGRKALVDDVKAEIEEIAKDYDKFADYRRVRGLWIALEILDNIGKEESEEQNERKAES